MFKYRVQVYRVTSRVERKRQFFFSKSHEIYFYKKQNNPVLEKQSSNNYPCNFLFYAEMGNKMPTYLTARSSAGL